jgi:5-methylcytosine-specific restriction endonuclease McrA
MENKSLSNIERWSAVSELIERLEGLGYHERIKLIHSKYKNGLLNIEEYSDLIGLTIDAKESGKIKHGRKRDPVNEEKQKNNIINNYVCYRNYHEFGYQESIERTAKDYKLSPKTIEGYITKNKGIVDELIRHLNFTDEERAEFEREIEWHTKRLKLGTTEEFEIKLSKEKNFVKILTSKPVNISQMITKAFADGLRPELENPDIKKNSKVKK